MKKKPQKPSSRKPFYRFVLHLFRLIGFTAGLLILLALFHLRIIGLPDSLTRRLTARLRDEGIPLHIESISLSLRRGWVLHNPRLYSNSPDNLEPALETDRLYIRALPEQWKNLSDTKWKISISGKNIKITPEYLTGTALPGLPPTQTIHKLQAQLNIDRSNLKINLAEVQFKDLLLRASGQVAFPEKTTQTAPSKSPSESRPTPPIQVDLDSILETISAISFDSTPEINLQFEIPEDGLRQASARVTVFASDLQWKDTYYKRLGGSVSFDEQKLSIDSLKITAYNGGNLSVSGYWDMSNRTAQIRLSNTLPAKTLIALLPEDLKDQLEQTEIYPFGQMEFDLIAGPAQPKNLLKKIDLQVHSMQVRRNELTLSQLRFDLSIDGQQLEISNLEAAANGDPLSGNFILNLNSKAWKMSAKGAVQPNLINPFLPEPAQDWINRFNFTQPPNLSVTLSKDKEQGTFQMETAVSGKDFSCVGIPFNDLGMTLAYTNRTFTLSPLHLTRDNRIFNGTVQLDFRKSLAFFDAASSFEPSTVARIIAPNHPTVLTNFTFSGPIDYQASGQIDYSGGTNHAATGTFRADTISAKNLTATSFSSRVETRNDQLLFTDASAELLGGNARGSAVFDLRFNDRKAPYQMKIDLSDLKLNQVTRYFGTNSVDETKGQVSVSLNIAADASGRFWDTATGNGRIEIKDGQLKDIPVLGGFSRFIRTSLPGFSLFSLTTLYSEYELHDGMFHTDNLELGGTLLSAKARGTYSPQQGLDFIVQAEPLRQTRDSKEWYMLHLWLAKALKEGTAPLFRLLEFELKGPINDPKWRLVNLPKEVSNLLQTPVQIPGTKKKEDNP